jgi:predicted transcriptional regulator
MSATEIIKQFKSLPVEERRAVAQFILDEDTSWIPASFRKGMADIEAGRTVEMETALTEKPPSRR